MWHFFTIIIVPLIVAGIGAHCALLVGSIVLGWLEKKGKNFVGLEKIGISVLLGYGLVAYFGLLLSFFGSLNFWIISSLALCGLVAGRKKITTIYTESIIPVCQQWGKQSTETKLLLITIGFGILFYLSSAFVPPYRNDALAYHLPEAMSVAQQGIHFPVNGNLFYGNLPVLMEVLYGLLYTVQGFTLIHLTHFQILLAGLVVLGGFLKREYNVRSALFALLGILTMYELFVDSTNAYVDAAMVSFETTALLCVIAWVKNRQSTLLIIAGVSSGFALSIKYNALYGALITGSILLFFILRERAVMNSKLKKLIYFVFPLLFVCAFWYIKNAVLYHNPVYPFYFGHNGFSNNEYKNLLDTIKLFEMPRDLLHFLLIPFHFFTTSYYILIFIAYLSWPFNFLRKDLTTSQRQTLSIFSIYILIYTVIWFFFATHQIKFFFVPMILLFIILGNAGAANYGWLRQKLPSALLLGGLAVVVISLVVAVVKAKNGYFIIVKKAELRYAVGLDTIVDFYQARNLGQIYSMSQYINQHYHDTIFFTVWGTPSFFIKNNNQFKSFPDALYFAEKAITTTTVKELIKQNKISYVLIDGHERDQSFRELVRINNSAFTAYRDNFLVPLERGVLSLSKKIFEQDGISIYSVN